MIKKKELFRKVWPEPFRPYRIRTVDGRAFDIDEPEAVGVGASRISISTVLAEIPNAEGPFVWVPLEQIESIEPLDAPIPSDSK